MNNSEAIDRRISRRTYLPAPLKEGKVVALSAIIDRLNRESGLDMTYLVDGSKAFGIGKSYGLFKGVKALIVMKGEKNIKHLKEKVGYYGEILVLEATKLGLGTCWVAGTFDRESRSLGAQEDQEVICVLTIGDVPENATIKEKFIRGMIHRRTKPISELCSTDVEPPDWFLEAMAAVQKAPTALNGQKVFFRLNDNIVTASVPDDYPSDLIDLGICKLHFEYEAGGKFELGNGGQYVPKEVGYGKPNDKGNI